MKYIFIFQFFLVFLLFFAAINKPNAHAQSRDRLEILVGTVAPQEFGNDNLGPGEFEVPFKCNLNYWSWTYSGHSAYSVDINRGGGSDDRGDAVLASADGKIYDVLRSHGQVAIEHEGKYFTQYVHMQNIIVNEGQIVKLGQKIGEIGDTGSPDAYHLHVNHSKGPPNVYVNGILVNRIKVCYKRYGCNPVSLPVNDRIRYGTDYNKGC